jgi:hypothetical protein
VGGVDIKYDQISSDDHGGGMVDWARQQRRWMGSIWSQFNKNRDKYIFEATIFFKQPLIFFVSSFLDELCPSFARLGQPKS